MNEDEIFEILKKDCKQYLDVLKNCRRGYFLLRGYFYQIDAMKKFDHNLDNRKPKNMSQDNHDKINNHFLPIFNWKIRNGIFCYGFDILNNKPKDLGYGIFYLFFPIGNFNYVYSPEYFDLFVHINQTKGDINEIISNLDFKDVDFCNVMKLRKEFDDFGNEVSIKANSYYLLNTSYAEKFSLKIWGY